MTPTAKAGSRQNSGRRLALLIAFVVLAGFAAANAHLVYVAMESQPDCLAPEGGEQTDGRLYRAAKLAC